MKYDISITKTTTPKEKPTDESKLGFGKIFTDHMFMMDYAAGKGWYNARIIPFGPIPIHPASTVLHYGAEIFEGLKAYRAADGTIRMFRPMENIQRLNRSAERNADFRRSVVFKVSLRKNRDFPREFVNVYGFCLDKRYVAVVVFYHLEQIVVVHAFVKKYAVGRAVGGVNRKCFHFRLASCRKNRHDVSAEIRKNKPCDK